MLECCEYLRIFFKNEDMATLSSLLMKELTQDLVAVALDSLNPSSSLGFDGIPTFVYERFASYYTPQMFGAVQIIIHRGTLNPEPSWALFNPIHKARGIVKAEELRPTLVLQNTCHKWVAALLRLQLKDLLRALTPSCQKGFIRGRFVLENLWEAAGTRASVPCAHDSYSLPVSATSHELIFPRNS